RATSGGAGAAYLFDSAGDDALVSTGVSSVLEGSGFCNLVTGFALVNASAGAGGSDWVDLQDATGQASFMGQGSGGSLAAPGYQVIVNGFALVRATDQAAGADQLLLGALDFLFQDFGNWQ